MRKRGLRSGFVPLALALPLATSGAASAAEWVEEDDLSHMDLEQLMDLEVTTASKRATKVSKTPAAVFVISQDDIRRSGATTVPEALRLAPGVHVARIDSNSWAISARGFNDEFANKLLVMIDGRSIYTPLFAGVIWHEHELMLDDVERIEVVRGPGGTVWGANAVNGVIHIITKDARNTQGLLVSALAGDRETFTGAARYGGAIGDDLHYRFYGKFADRDNFESTTPFRANDDWQSVRAGGRIDWDVSDDGRLTLQGDFLDGVASRSLGVPGSPFTVDDEDDFHGGNVLARYSHTFSDTSDLSLQVYYDRIERSALVLSEDRDTVDVDFQHAFRPLPRNQIVWGAGYRLTADHIEGGSLGVTFPDERQRDHLYSIFVQDEITLVRDLMSLTVGSKFEHNDYTGFEFQPSARLLLTPHERHTLWGAVSRAVHTPSRTDEGSVVFRVIQGTPVTILGSRDFDAEDVLAFEAGYRTRPIDQVTFDVAGFYNRYDHIRSLDTVQIFPNVVQQFDNNVKGEGYGAEVAANWAVAEFLMLSGTYTFTRNDLALKTGGTDVATLADYESFTPRHQLRVSSHWILPWDLEFDASLGWVERLRGTPVDAYTRLDLRLGWRPIENLELALVGLNLIEEHQEFPTTFLTVPSEVPRSFYGTIRWLFR